MFQDNKKARNELKDTIKYLDEMLTYVSEEIKLLREGQSLTDASTRPLARLEQMGNEFIRFVFPFDLHKCTGLISAVVSHLKDLKNDVDKIYGKTGFRAKMKKPFQSKAILDHINQHKVYVKDARDKLVVCFYCCGISGILIPFKATAVLSTAREVGKIGDVNAKITDIHNHLVNILIVVPSMYTDILIDESFQDSAHQVCLCIFSRVC